MNDNKLIIFHELLHKLAEAKDHTQAEAVVGEFADKLNISDDSIYQCLLNDVKSLTDKFFSDEENRFNRRFSSKIIYLTEQEIKELDEANKVIDDNLLNYHFQPIVNTVDGHIYSYEALMRPKSELCPSPFHILKYAEYGNRLNDIQRLTFLNVLKLYIDKKGEFKDRLIFINSIPKTQLSDEDSKKIGELFLDNTDRVVVEMTEQSEYDSAAFDILKEACDRLDIKIAVDDYGTGYSNVKNLLAYMPRYIKIDRSLISGIDKDRKKQHFAREIIEFCKDNKIMSLAEGVETSEELRMVIRLGVDLVQGFYTSRPSPKIIDKIPYEIRQEIKRYHQERQDGKDLHVYSPEVGERVSLSRLENEEYKCILIGENGNGDVKIAGTAGVEYEISIETAKGYKGKITFEDVTLINRNYMPCITIGENCEVEIEFEGNDLLKKGGIKVPESSKAVFCGQGDLDIIVGGMTFYGIGNDENSRHGELVFYQDVNIKNNSAKGLCIGSGLGGKISILKGRMELKAAGEFGIGIGSFVSDADIKLHSCDITIETSESKSVGIGTYDGNCDVDILNSRIVVNVSSKDAVCIGSFEGKSSVNIRNSQVTAGTVGVDSVAVGTLHGDFCDVKIIEAKAEFNIMGRHCTSIGAGNGKTLFALEKASLTVLSQGETAIAIGGFTKENYITMYHSDAVLTIKSEKAKFADYFVRENISITGGRIKCELNEQEITNIFE
ncbi:MAG: EAL domain-containing protein [Ruminococcus sp.]|nr:EAL domain-containing protein [Ruminococcus sp.]